MMARFFSTSTICMRPWTGSPKWGRVEHQCRRNQEHKQRQACPAHLPAKKKRQTCADFDQRGDSRLFAGVDYPSDYATGLALGREVAARVIDHSKSDGASVPWTGTVLQGPGIWNGVNPAFPTKGAWSHRLPTTLPKSWRNWPGLRTFHVLSRRTGGLCFTRATKASIRSGTNGRRSKCSSTN
jgi:hypothetical protein